MKETVALKLNHEFCRLYQRGKKAVTPCVVVYCRKNRLGRSRLGLTVGLTVSKKAVIRNRTRRRIKEAYRTHEDRMVPGYDIVVVARVRASFACYQEVERHLLKAMDQLGLLEKRGGQ